VPQSPLAALLVVVVAVLAATDVGTALRLRRLRMRLGLCEESMLSHALLLLLLLLLLTSLLPASAAPPPVSNVAAQLAAEPAPARA
jgi:hypothetical protein